MKTIIGKLTQSSTTPTPEIECWIPTRDQNGVGLIILPGGGYGGLSEHEGKGYAEHFAQFGVACFVVKYRLGSKGFRHPAMLKDALAAWHKYKSSIHLRPDFDILCYPVITSSDKFCHKGSIANLLGFTPAPALLEEVSCEKHVTRNTPPCFIWHTAEDPVVPVENSLMFASALRSQGITFELHIYQRGRHGLGLKAPFPWAEDCLRWLKDIAQQPAGARVAEADLHEHVTNAFINPDKASSLPRVLIIGDSISIGYTDPVRRNLKGIAEVFRPPVNYQHTGYGLAQIKTWLGTSKWDVIHFNFGIWDTHLLDSKGNIVLAEDKNPPASGIRIRYTPEQYRKNLAQILEILKGTGAKFIWASTTPVMSRTGERFEAIPTLNRVATDLMKSQGIAIDDLYGFVLPRVKEWQDPDQCHFNAKGNEQLGKQVTECIQRAIKP